MWSPGGIICMRPDYVARLAGPLCDKRMGSRLWQPKVLKVAEVTPLRAHAPPPEHPRIQPSS